MKKTLLLICVIVISVSAGYAQSNYNLELAKKYTREAKYYQKKAVDYRKDANYYFNKAKNIKENLFTIQKKLIWFEQKRELNIMRMLWISIN